MLTERKITITCRECGNEIPPTPLAEAICVRCRADERIRAARPARKSCTTQFEVALAETPAPPPKDELEKIHDNDRSTTEMVLGEFLFMFAKIGDAKKIGQTLLTLAYLEGKTEFRTKTELAVQLKVSPGRVSQILSELPSEFKDAYRLKSRTAKARPSCREKSL